MYISVHYIYLFLMQYKCNRLISIDLVVLLHIPFSS